MNIKLFISERNGFIHYRDENNNIIPVQILQDNVIKLSKDIVITENTTGYRIVLYPTTDGTATYRLVSAPVSNTTFNTGGGSRRGVNVFDDGTFQGFTSNLNFTGAGVTVTIVNGQAVINIPDGGAGMIGGGGTLNRIPKFTPDGSTLGDSLLFDNGTTVQMGGTGAIPSAQFAMTSTTQGFLSPRMTTGERNLIAAPATGLLIYNTSTSLFSYWDGAAWQNIDSQAGGDVSGSGVTGNISYWTDGPNSVLGDTGIAFGNVYIQNGNSFGADAFIGTNDAFSFNFETSSSLRGTIGPTGLWGINTAPVGGTLLSVQGIGTTSATFIADFYNSTPTAMVRFRSDGHVAMGIANGSMTIGLGAGFVSTVANNTFIGVNVGVATTTGESNTALGSSALAANTTGTQNIAIGGAALGSHITGDENTAVGFNAMVSHTSGSSNTALGTVSLNSNTTGFQNTIIGRGSFYYNLAGDANVGLGYNAGVYERGSNKLFIDNMTRGDGGAWSAANEADGRAMALVYGKFAATTPDQSFNVNANLGIGLGITDNTFGTAADFVLGIMNGATEVSTSPANMIQIYSVDVNTGVAPLASLGLRTEQAVQVVGLSVVSQRLRVKINGTEYYLLLDTI